MQNVTSRNSEYIGVKVALCVLLLLFLLSFVEPTATDDSLKNGLELIDDLVAKMNYSQTEGDQVQPILQEQVNMWTAGLDEWGKDRKLVFLSLQQTTYCDDVSGGSTCELRNSADLRWQPRLELDEVDKALKDSDFRRVDLVLLRIPDFSDVEISAEDLERRTQAVAVLNGRDAVIKSSTMSLITTCCVIVVILSGITMLTKDLTFLSRGLLKPLVELADEMESITRLQLAGVSGSEDTSKQADASGHNVSEIRLIRKTFENMKKAIKSWGKYVPWPVVQLLLRKDAEAAIDVGEREVSIYFSDIASFTTIVESLPPESSLLLLSRYFHDMSKTIDEFGGIVLEFIGDAIMAIYGAPVRNDDHPTSAVKAAIRMQEQLITMNRWFAERSLPQVGVRCGVHTGNVVVGNMGFQSRMKYGVVGEESEIPAHLEEMNKHYNTKMLISHATYSRINPNAFIIRPIDFAYLVNADGGSSGEVQLVYNVMDREKGGTQCKQRRAVAEMHTAAMDAYKRRDFQTALAKFKNTNNMMQDLEGIDEDMPAAIFIKRCQHYLESPPPATWDGMWDQGKQ